MNGLWEFSFCENFAFTENDYSPVVFTDKLYVPSAFDAMPAYAGKRGVAFFRRKVQIPPGRNARIYFGAVGMYCKVFIDNVKIGEHYSPYTAFECDIPAAEHEDREICVMACNCFDYELCCLQEAFFDFYAYGGIFRDVFLHVLPEGNLINWVGVNTLDWKTGELQVKIKSTLENGAADININFNDSESFKFAACFENNECVLTFKVRDFEPWSPENPVMSALTADIGSDAVRVNFGIRQVKAENGKILINEKPVKLLGYCRHEAHPQYGPALPYQQLVADIEIIKDLGCNFIRGSHYPQDPRFLDLCDRMGIMVFEEAMGWGQTVKHFQDRNFVDAQIKQVDEMISASYNHPSVIIYGFLNEGESDQEESRECYTRIIKRIKQLAPDRLVTYASNKGLEDKFLEEVDVISLNTYPGWYSYDSDSPGLLDEVKPRVEEYLEGLKKRGLSHKPFILSEIGGGALWGCHDPGKSLWSEEFQRELLERICREVTSRDSISGVALWQFCDIKSYNTARAVFRPRSFNNKGTLDEYRRPKLSYNTVKNIFSEYRRNK